MNQETKTGNDILKEVKYVPQGSDNLQQLKSDDVTKKRDTVFLYFTVITGELLLLSLGSVIIWTSPVIPKLLSNSTEVNPLGRPISTEEISMLAGLPNLTGLFGCFLLPKFSDMLGRKRFIQIIGVITIIMSTLLAYSNQISLLIIWRSINSFFLHGIYAAFPIYITEICEDRNRAKFGCFSGIFHQTGHFYGYAVGPFLSIRNFTLMTILPIVVFLILSVFIPESPFYLLLKSGEGDCLKSLRKLRSNKNSVELQSDLVEIQKTLEQKKIKGNIFGLLKTRETRIGLLLGLLPNIVQHCTGISAIMVYLAPIFNSTGIHVSGHNLAMLVALVKISTFTFTSFVVERFGRKRMLIISSIGTGLPLFVLGVFFYLKQTNSPLLIHLQWLPIVSVLCLVIMYSIGLGPVPMAVMTEMFPSHYRAVACSFVVGTTTLIVTCVTTGFPIIAAYFGTQYCVWTFSVFCFIGAALIHVFLPDTKGMSLNEIQEMLKKY